MLSFKRPQEACEGKDIRIANDQHDARLASSERAWLLFVYNLLAKESVY
jgi:hypothetical protein